MALDFIQYAPIIRTPVQFTYNGDTSWKVKVLHPNQANRDEQTKMRFIVYDSDRTTTYRHIDCDCDFSTTAGIQEVVLPALNSSSWIDNGTFILSNKNYKIQVCYGTSVPSEGYWSQAKIFTCCTEPTVTFKSPVQVNVTGLPDGEEIKEVKIVEIADTAEVDLTDWYAPLKKDTAYYFYRNIDISKYLADGITKTGEPDPGKKVTFKWYLKTNSGKELTTSGTSLPNDNGTGCEAAIFYGELPTRNIVTKTDGTKEYKEYGDSQLFVTENKIKVPNAVDSNANTYQFVYYPYYAKSDIEVLTIPVLPNGSNYYWLPPMPEGTACRWRYSPQTGSTVVAFQKVVTKFGGGTGEESIKGWYTNYEYGEYPVLCDKDNTLMMKFNSLPTSFKRTIQEQKQDTIGGEYPYISRNGQANYAEIPFKILLSSDCGPLSNADREKEEEAEINGRTSTPQTAETTENYTMAPYVSERQYRDKVLKWLTNGEVKIFRSTTEGVFAVRLMNVSCTPQTSLGNKYYEVSGTMYEVEPVNQWVVENYIME